MQALRDRKSERSFADRPLTVQELSNLLWAANGINRSDGHRTAPSARNVQEFDLYVIRQDGIYVYEPKQHQLRPIAAGDHRKSAGNDSYVATAPLNLIYVADLSKISWTRDPNVKLRIAGLNVGFIAENVALFCSSEGLNSVPRISIDTDSLSAILKLRPEQKIILATSVGPPK
ncbi:MAG: SagB/ThcOx family dehydrogenase [Veillonellaceae bacterium]|nr:SagB/ThcOx family dehydrogenase [Veillonellaceae bacterium]